MKSLVDAEMCPQTGYSPRSCPTSRPSRNDAAHNASSGVPGEVPGAAGGRSEVLRAVDRQHTRPRSTRPRWRCAGRPAMRRCGAPPRHYLQADLPVRDEWGFRVPEPIDTSGVALDEYLVELSEILAKNFHDRWARQLAAEGW